MIATKVWVDGNILGGTLSYPDRLHSVKEFSHKGISEGNKSILEA